MKSTSVLKTGEGDMSASGTHNPPEFKHAEDMEWEMARFSNVTKFLFHPRPERPTEPNAGFLKYAPGASFPLHVHRSAGARSRTRCFSRRQGIIDPRGPVDRLHRRARRTRNRS